MPLDLSPEFKQELSYEITGLLTERNPAGAIVGVVSDGEIVWEQADGYSDLKSGRTPDRDTVFRIASITKTFTATAIFQLRDAGLLSLDDPVDSYIPELKDSVGLNGRSHEITVRRLLSHTAGLTAETPVGRPYISENRPPDRAEAIASLKNTEFTVEPGTRYRYSNFGFALLGELITRVSDQPYESYVLQKICSPLGLASTSFSPGAEQAERSATGYVQQHRSSGLTETSLANLGFDSSAGQLYSTLNDLSTWLQFHLDADTAADNDVVLSKRSRLEMREPQDLAPDWNGGVCMNWLADKLGDVVVFRHGGGCPGFSLEVSIIPSHRFGVVSLANTSNFNAPISKVVIEKLVNRPVPKRAPEKPDIATEPPADMAELTGLYRLDQILIWVDWSGDSLRIGAEDQVANPGMARLEPTGNRDEFAFPNGRFQGDKYRFERSEIGKVTGYVWGAFRAVKLTEAE